MNGPKVALRRVTCCATVRVCVWQNRNCDSLIFTHLLDWIKESLFSFFWSSLVTFSISFLLSLVLYSCPVIMAAVAATAAPFRRLTLNTLKRIRRQEKKIELIKKLDYKQTWNLGVGDR